jgi:hypothetical protein
MPATKISALTAGGASQATDEYVVARAGDNRKITGANIAAAATAVGTLTSGAIGAGFTAIPNTALANSSITINGTPVALGGSTTVSASAAGSNTQVQFNSSGSLAGDSGFTFSSTNKALTLGGATITANAPVLDLTQTWNNAAVLFTGFKFNVTDTASNVSSLLFDLQVGAATKFSIRKDGVVNFYGGQYGIILRDTSGNIRGSIDTYSSGYGLGQPNLQQLSFMTDGIFRFTSSAAFGWSSATNPSANAADVTLFRDAASVLALRTGTTAQTFRLYNTFTDASNYERGKFEWASNVLRIGTEKLGTGSARAVELQTDGTTALTLTTGQKAEFAQTIKTGAPSGGTAAEWKLGTVATVSPTSPNRTIEVDIGGTIYYIHAKTTNN